MCQDWYGTDFTVLEDQMCAGHQAEFQILFWPSVFIFSYNYDKKINGYSLAYTFWYSENKRENEIHAWVIQVIL